MKKILSILSLLLLNVLAVAAQNEKAPTFYDLKQLVPLVSTCEDVKKILKIDDCSSSWIEKKYKDFSVFIAISNGESCQANKSSGKRWNVPQGTVLQLSISLRRVMFLSEYEEKFKENLKEYKKTEVSKLHGLYYYDNEEKGIYVSTEKEVKPETVVRISLYPQRSRESGCENIPDKSEEFPTFLELKQLVPLVSTCEDVKKILKIDDCSSLLIHKKYKDFSAMITISDAEPCQANKFYGKRWNIPQGTVLHLSISLPAAMPLSEYEEKFKENLKEYRKTEVNDLPGFYYYENEEKGITFSTTNAVPPEEYITNISLYPPKSKESECEKKAKTKSPMTFSNK